MDSENEVVLKDGSLAPIGKTSSYFQARSVNENDPAEIMARLWKEKNTRHAYLNGALVPLDFATHICNDLCRSKEGIVVQHHFELDKDMSDRDVAVAMGTVQWLATNCGQGFLIEFFREIGREVRMRR